MITDKTVFILGAGASKPYGFPTAAELRSEIIYNFPQMFNRAHAEFYSVPESQVDLSKNFQNVINTFKHSSTKSIDLFLSRNKQFYEIGKKIIAFLIASYEIKSTFREDVPKPEFDWYMQIYDLLTNEITKAEDLVVKFKKNNVSFITFNYDRSFEQFVYESLLYSFTSQRNEVLNLIKTLGITHIYGKIAPLPWESPPFYLEYGSSHFFGYLDELVNNIKIIFEERINNIEEAKKKISEANKIFFLGFSYADENLTALEFSSLLNEDHWVYGTAMGSTEVERQKIVSKLKGKNTRAHHQKIVIQDIDSVMLLRNHIG